MIHFIFSEQDPRYLFLKYDNEDDDLWLRSNPRHINLTDHINLVDPTCYLKTYKGPKFTQDFLFEYIQPKTGQKIYYCSIGLWQDIYKFFKANNVEFDGLDEKWFKRKLKHSFDEFKEIVNSWGLKFPPRPYQYEAAYKILCWKKSISELATRAGKTLIAYMVFRYSIEYLGMKNILMIVPSIDLVKQAYGDFKEYAEFFNTECIWSGGKEVASSNLTVGTFQSLIKYIEKDSSKYNPKFFEKFDCVFVDEVHRAKASQIKNIISQPFMKDVVISFGMTGTLPAEKSIEHYCIFSLLGAKIQAITTKQLKDAGYISDIEIYQYRLHYNDFNRTKDIWKKCVEYALSNYDLTEDKKKIELPEDKKEYLLRYSKTPSIGLTSAKGSIFGNSEWSDLRKEYEYINLLKTIVSDSTGTNSLALERMMIHFFEERIDLLIDDVIPKCPNNMLILAHHTEYINHIVDRIKETYNDTRIIVKITGSVSAKKRDKIKQLLKENNNCILVASYGCMSTGITLANLCYGVLFESFKSDVVNMQSIGRGLGLSDLKDKYILYDFVDVFDKEITNKIFLQGLARIKIYNRESNQHKYSIKKFNIGKQTDDVVKWKQISKESNKEKENKPQIEQPSIIEDTSKMFQLTFDF
jgi:superfamily II DNA or RNA helicase